MSNCCSKSQSAVETTIKLLQPKWTLQIVHELQQGQRRFNELASNLGGVNPRTLCQRLRELEEHGIVEREIKSSMPPWVEYSLTEKGISLHGVIDSMVAWGHQWVESESDSAETATPVKAATHK